MRYGRMDERVGETRAGLGTNKSNHVVQRSLNPPAELCSPTGLRSPVALPVVPPGTFSAPFPPQPIRYGSLSRLATHCLCMRVPSSGVANVVGPAAFPPEYPSQVLRQRTRLFH